MIVFVLASAFYVWTAATSQPLELDNGSSDRYNQLASALLHLHTWVAHAPAWLTKLSEPYNPAANSRAWFGSTDATNIGDDIYYRGYLYFLWGPAPAAVLLVPMHLLGWEPSSSVTVSVFGVAGLGFALATLRVLLRQIGTRSLWMCALAAFAAAFSSAVPFLLRSPYVSADTLAGGYCFSMAGVWLALSALAAKRASLPHLALASLCFGLAAGARPVLALTGLVLVPVYLALRAGRSSRALLTALVAPIGVCGLLLLAYNQVRFGGPFEFGLHIQLTGYDSSTAPIGRLGYVLPGTWLYAITPPKLSAAFPFILLQTPSVASPSGLASSELTGGLLPMAPIVLFLGALPWLWRRRPGRLGALAGGLMVLAGVGLILTLVPAFDFFASTERYEVEFSTLFVLGGLAAWLGLSMELSGYRGWLVRAGGGALALWGSIAGFAISLVGNGNLLAINHPQTWRTLEEIASPLSSLLR
ncbi:MAG TPA: hypothetical protein VMG62_03015 [Solirubrobacteraceae bacterium]|nr:hypothetical protein [Solirubrobacteraceae bacterium]